MSAAVRHDGWRRWAQTPLIGLAVMLHGKQGIAQPLPNVPATDRAAAQVDAIFADYTTPHTPGAAVVVARGDSIVFARGYGLADAEHEVAVSPATSFRLASVTKQFTAAALLSLVEAGKLSLDDPIGRYLPDVPEYARRIRVRQLLAHTSGIPDYEPLVGNGDGPQVTDRDVLQLLHQVDRLYFTPGASWRYSNSGYALLALIVERVTGESFAAYLRHRIFDRAGMASAVAHRNGVDTVVNRAFGYSSTGKAWHLTDQSRTSAVLGDGGIYASAEELAHWSAALDRGAVLASSTFALATTPATLASGKPTSYGFGWFLDEFEGHRRQRHEGDSIGFRTAIQRYPDERLTVVVLVNRGAAPIDALSDGVARIYLAR